MFYLRPSSVICCRSAARDPKDTRDFTHRRWERLQRRESVWENSNDTLRVFSRKFLDAFWSEVHIAAVDRAGWRESVDALCATWREDDRCGIVGLANKQYPVVQRNKNNLLQLVFRRELCGITYNDDTT